MDGRKGRRSYKTKRGNIIKKTHKMRETEKQRENIEEARKELRIARRICKKTKKQWEMG